MPSIDLRLLSVFETIYRTSSVSIAADALELGQPAVSIALAKLRHHFGDPLFVRTPKGMEPTPFADSLIQPVRDALQSVEIVLAHSKNFEPGESERVFRICMTDISQLVLLPPLLKKLRDSAPGIRIEVFPLSDDTGRMLRSGEVDLALGVMPQLEAGFFQQLLFRQGFVCIVGSQHPRITEHLDIESYSAEDHAVISAAGAAPLIIDREVARQGIRRRIALKLPNYLGAAFVIENTDLIITIPQRLAELLETHCAFRIFPVPFTLPAYEVKQHWHERYHHDEGNRWLRRTVSELISSSSPRSASSATSSS